MSVFTGEQRVVPPAVSPCTRLDVVLVSNTYRDARRGNTSAERQRPRPLPEQHRLSLTSLQLHARPATILKQHAARFTFTWADPELCERGAVPPVPILSPYFPPFPFSSSPYTT